MRYSHIKTSVLEQFKAPNGHKIVPFILGAPVGGKSACAREVINELGIDNVVEFTASLREVIDPSGQMLVIFGAGGAARAIAVELAQEFRRRRALKERKKN